ncbi:MAG TPA: DNA polymerase III subunit alpha [Clostridiales bacterium]|nr:DNA polymerase III subunit alpha [Clostridiales bacterium]
MTKNNGYIHLHTHTEYSLLDGLSPIKDLVAEAKRQNAKALAITDHGNLYGALKFFKACKEAKIKPIIGCEFYVTDDIKSENKNRDNDHLVLLAKNEVGYKNLCKLNTLAFTEGFYFKPRIDLNLLEKHSEGLICLTACLAGRLPRILLDDLIADKYQKAVEYALKLKSLFADGDFYIELQDHNLKEQKLTNPLLAKIAKEIGVKCVATNDIHYLNKADAKYHDILLCVQTQKTLTDENRMRFPNDEFYFKTKEEMEEIFSWCPEATSTPDEIAEKCNFTIGKKGYQLPEYKCPDNLTANEYLRVLTQEGLKKRYEKITDEILKRAEVELDVIIRMGFAEYYLIVWDFIDWAKKHDVPVGPGRGSGVGSIVAYAIGITNIDPLKYGLIFERFLNEDRMTMPDFDIDFCQERRSKVIDYVTQKYGEDHISKIITFGSMKKKQAIRDAGRVYGVSFDETTKLINAISENIFNDKDLKLIELLNPNSPKYESELDDLCKENPVFRAVIEAASKIDNLSRQSGIHAAGVVIYKNPAIDTLPLAKNKDDLTTQYDKDEVEEMGLLKMDFLGLQTLTDLKQAHDTILQTKGVDITFDDKYDDPKVYELISSGDTDAVFQLESPGMKSFMKRLKPTSLEDIIAGVALYRPGPMDNIDTYIESTHNPQKIKYLDDRLKDILGITAGIIVYQEQAMRITQVLAGYSLNRADNFRRIISKKKTAEMEEEGKIFIYGKRDADGNLVLNDKGLPEVPGCIENGISEEVATEIFKQMKNFAEYAFNKSHATAYAVIAYMTAYYKAYYPVEYMAAVINSRIDKADEMRKYLPIIKKMGIDIVKPDINDSQGLFMPENKSIRYGLGCVKNLGKQAVDDIISEREKNGKYKSFYDFIYRIQKFERPIAKDAIENLIYGGALDCLGEFRSTMMVNLQSMIKKAKANYEAEHNQNPSLLDYFKIYIELDTSIDDVQIKEYPHSVLLDNEMKALNMYISGHPLDAINYDKSDLNFDSTIIDILTNEENDESENFDELETNTYDAKLKDGDEVIFIGIIREVKKRVSRNGSNYYQIQVEDNFGTIDMIAFEYLASKKGDLLVKGKIVKVIGSLSIRGNNVSVRCNDLFEIESNSKKLQKDARYLYVLLDETNHHKKDAIETILKNDPGLNPVYYQYNDLIYKFDNLVDNLVRTEEEIKSLLCNERNKQNKVMLCDEIRHNPEKEAVCELVKDLE